MGLEKSTPDVVSEAMATRDSIFHQVLGDSAAHNNINNNNNDNNKNNNNSKSNSTTSSSNSGRTCTDIITFYNSVFVPKFDSLLLQIGHSQNVRLEGKAIQIPILHVITSMTGSSSIVRWLIDRLDLPQSPLFPHYFSSFYSMHYFYFSFSFAFHVLMSRHLIYLKHALPSYSLLYRFKWGSLRPCWALHSSSYRDDS